MAETSEKSRREVRPVANQVSKCVIEDDEIFVDGKTLAYVLGLTSGRVYQMEGEEKIFRTSTPQGDLFKLASSVQAYIDSVTGEDDEESATYRVSREKAEAEYKHAKAQLAALEVEEVRGSLHRSSDVQAITEDYLFAVRGLLMSLPGQLATEVARSDSPAECAAIIRTVVNQVLMEMSQYGYDPAKYEERVRERLKWESRDEENPEESLA